MEEKKILAIYARQSREKETTGSIEDQIISGIKKADELNYRHEIYVDRGKSALSNDLTKRPEFQKLLTDAEKGLIHAVYVVDESRITRNEEIRVLVKTTFIKHNIKIYTKLDGNIDFQDSSQNLFSTIRSAFNEKYARDTSVKIQSVLKNRAIKGLAHTGITPYGFKKDNSGKLIIDKDESIVIKIIFDLYLAGNGTKKIANYLNTQKIETKSSKFFKDGINILNKYTGQYENRKNISWAPNTVLNIIKNPIYKGERRYKAEIIPCDSIIEKTTWEKAKEIINSNQNKKSGKKYNYLLNGLIFCSCGLRLTGRTRENKKDHYYYCVSKRYQNKQCTCRSINIDEAEKLAWYTVVHASNSSYDFIKEKINNTDIKTKSIEIQKRIKALNSLIKSEENKRDKIFELYSNNIISVNEVSTRIKVFDLKIENYKNEIKNLDDEIEIFKSKKSILSEHEMFTHNMQDLLLNASYELKHKLLHNFIERIEVSYNNEEKIHEIEITTIFDNAKFGFTHYLLNGRMLEYMEDEFNRPPHMIQQPMLKYHLWWKIKYTYHTYSFRKTSEIKYKTLKFESSLDTIKKL